MWSGSQNCLVTAYDREANGWRVDWFGIVYFT